MKCRICGENKGDNDFYYRKYGLPSTICKICDIKRVGRYYRANYKEIRAKENVRNVDRRKRIKDAVFAAYGGYVCVCCGETERAFLTLDHVNNDGNKHRKDIVGRKHFAGAHTYGWLVKQGFPSGFQVLCMNCNWGKRLNGVCPHKVRCNDYPQGVGQLSPKRSTPVLKIVGQDEDIVSSA
jgi:hypothetical protein